MAAYAGTNTLVFSTVWGNKRVNLWSIDVTNYNSTGIPTAAADMGLDALDALICFENAGGYHTKWISASSIAKAYVITTGVECADDVDIGATQMIYLLAIGS